MSANAPHAENAAAHATGDETYAVERPRSADTPLKRRLTERFSVPGALVVCYRRTIIGTWKAREMPFHVYNLGMGGVNFWNLGMTLKPGAKIKLTILMPKANPIDVLGIVVWSKAAPRPGSGDGAPRYTQITGVKFVDYDAGAWAALCEVHQNFGGGSQNSPSLRCSPAKINLAKGCTNLRKVCARPCHDFDNPPSFLIK